MSTPVVNRPLFGPFKRTPDEFAKLWPPYKDRLHSPYELKMAFGHSGDVEIELKQWVSGDSRTATSRTAAVRERAMSSSAPS
jgi:hypothetical protein